MRRDPCPGLWWLAIAGIAASGVPLNAAHPGVSPWRNLGRSAIGMLERHALVRLQIHIEAPPLRRPPSRAGLGHSGATAGTRVELADLPVSSHRLELVLLSGGSAARR